MSVVVPADELARTAFCKIYGCEREALATRGLYAYLCDEHTAAARAKRRTYDPGPRVVIPLVSRPGLVECAKRLVPAAKELEQKVHARRRATGEAREALGRFNEQLIQLKQAAEELLKG